MQLCVCHENCGPEGQRQSKSQLRNCKVSEFDAYRKLTMYLDLLTRNIYNSNQRITGDIKPCELFGSLYRENYPVIEFQPTER